MAIHYKCQYSHMRRDIPTPVLTIYNCGMDAPLHFIKMLGYNERICCFWIYQGISVESDYVTQALLLLSNENV